MAYSTGSGNYIDLMAAVLAHAIADGWTTSGGTWPISKGNIRGVNWATSTRAVTDFTTGTAVSITERIIRLAIGTSLANSTANAAIATNSVLITGMQYAITDWHIFSDPGVGKPDYIHVVTRYSNGVNPEVFNHFSFGELDKGGMTYGAVSYVASHARRGYIPFNGGNGWQAWDWYCANTANWPMHFGGSSRGERGGSNRQTSSEMNLLYLISPVSSPVPATGGWTQPDVLTDTNGILDTQTLGSSTPDSIVNWYLNGGNATGLVAGPGAVSSQPYSGGVTLQSLPFILLSGNVANISPAMFLGVFPGVRLCSMQAYNPRDEVTYAADTWKLMPLLRKTIPSQAMLWNNVSSAEVGYAYKKVA